MQAQQKALITRAEENTLGEDALFPAVFPKPSDSQELGFLYQALDTFQGSLEFAVVERL